MNTYLSLLARFFIRLNLLLLVEPFGIE
ncbi:hypothetical protein F383_34985 [Gossypium arboreum]|uniref:Uncharacterized protein n=1 Tax=Gossypium arboreum TaxID=29729 RepID=A0A0B0PY20_GOSAR|nr:hypothetical protein F383_34985 [Gossypium arboreum]